MQDLGAFEGTQEVLIELRKSVSSLTSGARYTDGLKAEC